MEISGRNMSGSKGPRSVRLILNERAAADQRLRAAAGELRRQDYNVEGRVLWELEDATVFAREAAEAGCDVIVAGGGDGTVNRVATGILQAAEHAQNVMAVLPYGTANDFAISNGLFPEDPVAALKWMDKVEPKLIDVGQVNGRNFINVASGGRGAEVTTETPLESKQLLGKFSYFITGLANVATLDTHHARLNGPDFQWEGNLLAVVVGNGRQAGGGFHVTPRAMLDDGLLDVLIIPDVPWTQFVALVGEFVNLGGETRSQHMIYQQLPWLELESADPLQFNLDGEPIRDSRFRFEIAGRKLSCLLPPNSPLIGRTEATRQL